MSEMINILNAANINAHQGRPRTPQNKKITLWKSSDSFLHCCIESRGCRFSNDLGSCVMCDYGVGSNLKPSELKKALYCELLPNLKNIKTVLFGSYGSVFDEYEISEECFDVILLFLSEHAVDRVIFETHYSTVNIEKLQKIRNALERKCSIIIELGYETCDEYILNNCLRKVMNLSKLKEKIDLIHDMKMHTCLNVFVGAPFISVQDQTLSALRSIKWAFSSGADSVVIFPSNIKPFTLLHKLYLKGYYSPISQWQVIDLLNKIPDELLSDVSLSWYGNRDNIYEDNAYPLIPPCDCEKCHNMIFKFYNNFHIEKRSNVRKALIEELINKNSVCSCYKNYIHSYENVAERLTEEKIEEIINEA